MQKRYSNTSLASLIARAPNTHVRPSRTIIASAVRHLKLVGLSAVSAGVPLARCHMTQKNIIKLTAMISKAGANKAAWNGMPVTTQL